MKWINRFFIGRLSQKNYYYSIFFLAFVFLLGYSLLIFIPIVLRFQNIPDIIYLLGYLLIAAMIFFSYSLYVRRLHDLGWSGKWQLLALIPLVSTFIGVQLLISPGDEKENKYGKPQRLDSFDIIANFFQKILAKKNRSSLIITYLRFPS